MATEKNHGRFKIFLGYAPGVGKTFSMLSEGIRRKSRETHGRAGTAEVASKLEQVPRKETDYKGTIFFEMGRGCHPGTSAPRSAHRRAGAHECCRKPLHEAL